ncbi:unnamed protein product, partial [Chrysoparadoxa australica]
SLRDYGGIRQFCGRIATVKCYENNPSVRQRLTKENGDGRVLVIDGGGSIACALMGDQLASGGAAQGWSGVIINGAIRDSVEISKIPIGCKALCTNPTKSKKVNPGEIDVEVTFAGLNFVPGHWIYADNDGIIVSSQELLLPRSKI